MGLLALFHLLCCLHLLGRVGALVLLAGRVLRGSGMSSSFQKCGRWLILSSCSLVHTQGSSKRGASPLPVAPRDLHLFPVSVCRKANTPRAPEDFVGSVFNFMYLFPGGFSSLSGNPVPLDSKLGYVPAE